MAAIGRGPKLPFLSGFLTIFLYLISQLTTPFLSDLKKISGEVVRVEPYGYGSEKVIRIWIDAPLTEPYTSRYIDVVDKYSEELSEVTIWVNTKKEIKQMKAESQMLYEYKWFNPFLLIILTIGVFFHIGAYWETRKKTTNINNYWDMWDYVFGGRKPIMKHNNKLYNPKDLFKF